GILAWCFREVQSHARFKPLPLLIEKRDKCHGRAAHLAGQTRQLIQRGVWSGIKEVRMPERRSLSEARIGFRFDDLHRTLWVAASFAQNYRQIVARPAKFCD